MKLYTLLPALLVVLTQSCSRESASPATTVAPEAPAIEVATQPAVLRLMPQYLRVTGELRGKQQSQVAADAAGKVIATPVERGTKVAAGDLMIQLDPKNAQLSLQEAAAALDSAKLKLEWQRNELTRNEPLAKSKAIADSDFQKLKLDLASAEASHAAELARRDMAEKALADTKISAPFSGVVSERLTEVGEYVMANTAVISLVAMEKLRLTLNVPETEVGKMKVDQQVAFNVPAYPGQEFRGVVKFMGSALRGASRDLQVEAEVPNDDGKLKPGMFAEGRVSLSEVEMIAIPSSSVRVEGTVRKVFVVENGKVVARLVEVGETKGNEIAIRRGLATGEAVIAEPGPNVIDGVKVRAAVR